MGLLRHFLFGCLSQLFVYEVSIVQLMAIQMMSFSFEEFRSFFHRQLVQRFRIKESQVFLGDNLTIYSLCMFDKNLKSKKNNGKKFCQLFQE